MILAASKPFRAFSTASASVAGIVVAVLLAPAGGHSVMGWFKDFGFVQHQTSTIMIN